MSTWNSFLVFIEKPLTQSGVAMVLAIIGTIVPSKIAMLVAGLVFLFAAYREGWFSGQKWYVSLGRVIGTSAIIAVALSIVWIVAWRFREVQNVASVPQTSAAESTKPNYENLDRYSNENSETKQAKRTSQSHPAGQKQSGKGNVQTGPINQGPGSALSFNQKGGVTAGTVNNTILSDTRNIPSEKVDALIGGLKGLGKGRVLLIVYEPLTTEVNDLLKQLQRIFSAAGWDQETGQSDEAVRKVIRSMSFGPGPTNNHYFVPDGIHCIGSSEQYMKTFDLLVRSGLECQFAIDQLYKPPIGDATIGIYIGRR
jgi:hypothetical protein